MNNYSDYVEYLHSLGVCKKVSEKICQQYENDNDMEGLMQFVLYFEKMVTANVD